MTKKFKPVVLMLGGFQGSGKTTVASILVDELGLVLLSTDEVRQKLFDEGHSFSKEFQQMVRDIYRKKLERAFKLGHSLVLDVMATSLRIREVEELIENEKVNKYQLIKVYLKASKKELVRRVASRKRVKGTYRGTVDELKASMKEHGEIDKSVYDLVVDTQKLDAKGVAEVIKGKIGSLE